MTRVFKPYDDRIWSGPSTSQSVETWRPVLAIPSIGLFEMPHARGDGLGNVEKHRPTSPAGEPLEKEAMPGLNTLDETRGLTMPSSWRLPGCVDDACRLVD